MKIGSFISNHVELKHYALNRSDKEEKRGFHSGNAFANSGGL
jgi:hypothetical protein